MINGPFELENMLKSNQYGLADNFRGVIILQGAIECLFDKKEITAAANPIVIHRVELLQ